MMHVISHASVLHTSFPISRIPVVFCSAFIIVSILVHLPDMGTCAVVHVSYLYLPYTYTYSTHARRERVVTYVELKMKFPRSRPKVPGA